MVDGLFCILTDFQDDDLSYSVSFVSIKFVSVEFPDQLWPQYYVKGCVPKIAIGAIHVDDVGLKGSRNLRFFYCLLVHCLFGASIFVYMPLLTII